MLTGPKTEVLQEEEIRFIEVGACRFKVEQLLRREKYIPKLWNVGNFVSAFQAFTRLIDSTHYRSGPVASGMRPWSIACR